MVELQGPQNLKMVELLGFKFAQKGLFSNFFAAPSTPRPILRFTTPRKLVFRRLIFCEPLDHYNLGIFGLCTRYLVNFWVSELDISAVLSPNESYILRKFPSNRASQISYLPFEYVCFQIGSHSFGEEETANESLKRVI